MPPKSAPSLTVLCSALVLFAGVDLVSGRGGGGGGRGGGGGGGAARASAARSAASRSAPAHYGSMRPTPSAPSRSTSFERSQSMDHNHTLDAARREQRSVETSRGGELALGVAAGGAIALRGETAGGREYAGGQGPGGNRVTAHQNLQGEVVRRTRGDGDGVVDRLPNGFDTIYVDNHPYYHHNHCYYWPYYYGGTVYYQEVYPPDGVRVEELPPEAQTVTAGGTNYYVYDEIYYTKDGDGYTVSTPPDEAAPATGSAGPRPTDLIQAMCAHIATCTNFVIDCTEQVERPGKAAETIKRRIVVSHPDRLAALGREGETTTRFWYDGTSVTTLDQVKNVYATVEAPPTIADMVQMLQDDYGVTFPLADVVSPETWADLTSVQDAMTYDGRETISGRDCHVVKVTTDTYEARVWIDAAPETPRPIKVDILHLDEGRRLRYIAVIEAWRTEPKTDPALFVFQPPAGAHRIEMLKRP